MTLLELYRYADANRIPVDAFPLGRTEALSLLDGEGGCHIAIDPFRVRSAADEKTKLGHELGHCMTGAFYTVASPCDVRARHENRADKWAVKQLIPVEELDEAIADGHTEIWDLADHFGVTEEFIRKAVCYYVHGNLATELYF